MLGKITALAGLLALLQVPAEAQTVSGEIRVVDADTIWVVDTKVRLHGIDAPEVGDTCDVGGSRTWACGRWTTDEMLLLYEGAFAICEKAGDPSFDRMVARCRADGQDMAERIVVSGLARADMRYSLDYVDAEKAAYFAGVGIWRGDVAPPESLKPASLDLGSEPSTGRDPEKDCMIKGNISSNGMIYHMPWQRDYNKTEISKKKGERWFCSEEEAIAAGWRRALQ